MDLAEEGATKLIKNNTGYPPAFGLRTHRPCLACEDLTKRLLGGVDAAGRKAGFVIALAASELH